MATDSAAQRTTFFKDVHLREKKVVIMTGDSIAHAFSLETNVSNVIYRSEIDQYLFNQSVAGSNLANFSGGDSATWNPLSIVTRSESGALNAFDITNADYILCWAGFNDFNDNIPLGAIDSNDPLTIAGAIRTTVANYDVRKPTLKVRFITPNNNPYETPDSFGVTFAQQAAWIKTVCDSIGIPCYDGLSNEATSGITDANKATMLPDQIHPIATRHQAWAPLIAAFMEANP